MSRLNVRKTHTVSYFWRTVSECAARFKTSTPCISQCCCIRYWQTTPMSQCHATETLNKFCPRYRKCQNTWATSQGTRRMAVSVTTLCLGCTVFHTCIGSNIGISGRVVKTRVIALPSCARRPQNGMHAWGGMLPCARCRRRAADARATAHG